jgi:hypothetical protein
MYDIDGGGNISYVRNICNVKERNYIMSKKKIVFEEVIRVRCSSASLWPMLGWSPREHSVEHSWEEPREDVPYEFTSLVATPWAYECSSTDPSGAEAVWGRRMAGRLPIKFQMVCEE